MHLNVSIFSSRVDFCGERLFVCQIICQQYHKALIGRTARRLLRLSWTSIWEREKCVHVTVGTDCAGEKTAAKRSDGTRERILMSFRNLWQHDRTSFCQELSDNSISELA
ncbi:hypothetical protein MTP99_005000 [Tenebrio molitor]|nr:hypothetical protein MTP99_005000 [Tenebrio molitor]